MNDSFALRPNQTQVRQLIFNSYVQVIFMLLSILNRLRSIYLHSCFLLSLFRASDKLWLTELIDAYGLKFICYIAGIVCFVK